MRKLALDDACLRGVEKPARYIGNEVNAVCKTPKEGMIRFAMCFPDIYEIGMSHLGIQILYEMFNRRPDVWCERVYAPWKDMETVLREKRIPLFALESQDPISAFDFLGITLQYEMCYTNILQVLDLSQIPLLQKDRQSGCPFVIGGGPCAYNPEPLADFFDLFYIGDGEVVYDALLDAYKEWKKSGAAREEFLARAAKIPGIYAPSLYEVSYHADGTIRSFAPKRGEIPAKVEKQIVVDLDSAPYPKAPVVPFIKATQDRVVLEIQRGCIRGCRFCQAGMVYRPTREHSVDFLKKTARELLQNTGHEEISLSSLSSSDYTQLPELLEDLMGVCAAGKVNISLPSLRIDAFSLDVMQKVQDVKKSSLTFAPEAGSQRLRDAINKGLTEDDILGGAREAFAGGWDKVKLYFMLGLPGETESDREAIATLSDRIAQAYYEMPRDGRKGRCQVTVSTAFFVPKPFTPFQWAGMASREAFLGAARTVNHAIKEKKNHRSIRYHWHEADVAVLEGVLARGDRRVGEVVRRAYENGARFDAWSEEFRLDAWEKAFADAGIDPDFYTVRERDVEEILPWDFLQVGVGKAFLQKEWERARQGIVTSHCRKECAHCGAARYGGGVCIEGKG